MMGGIQEKGGGDVLKVKTGMEDGGEGGDN